MSPKLLEALTSRLCSHEFAWPRRRANGEYYQVCVLCGAQYLYDWASMTRIERIAVQPPSQLSPSAESAGRRRSNWRPRARRLRVHIPMTYRQIGIDQWHTGTVENISQSGALFTASHVLARDTDLELILEMPEEITGQPNRRVLCTGYLVRATTGKSSSASVKMAAVISGYTFLHDAASDTSQPK